MTNSTDTTNLNSCGCCASDITEPTLYNPPGQPALNYRIANHSAALQRMLTRLAQEELPDGENAGARPLADLTARAPDDPAIALLDAWATVGHVLSFYQERIANEGYLRTATERRSVLELARAIGYELNPGVAASTYLAFTVDESAQTPDETTIKAGTQVQSIPAKEGELPQTFETGVDFAAKAWWNALRPQMSKPQTITLAADQVYLKGVNLNLTAGDRLLLVGKDSAGKVIPVRRRVRTLTVNRDGDYTLVTFEAEPNLVFTPGVAAAPALMAAVSSQSVQTTAVGVKAAFNATNIEKLLAASLVESQFQAILNMSGWKVSDLIDYAVKKTIPAASSEVEVYVLREDVSIFGHNAPHYQTLSKDARAAFFEWDSPDYEIWRDSVKPPATPGLFFIAAISTGPAVGGYYQNADLYLERPVAGILEKSWVVLERTGDYRVYQVTSAVDASLTGFGISAKGTGLKLSDPNGGGPTKDSSYKVRRTTAYVKSEKLELAAVPVTAALPLGATELLLNGLAPGLLVGQPVAITGEQADAPGVTRSEIKVLTKISHDALFTTLTFSEGLKYSYKRDTVTINANVVRATHGESVLNEVLGSGDGAQSNQRFKLKKPPLTYVTGATASGAENSLEVRVNGVAWQEAASLYGLNGQARAYIVRHDDDANAFVTFGDGKSGARLSTGQENITATYRSGIGSGGEVEASSLTLLKKRPFGIRSVLNPTAASGAQDPETLDGARHNAPLQVLTLERIVSLQDFEDFARAFAGIGKAQAIALWNGETELVHLTVADANGGEIASTSDLYKNLRDAINNARDPLRQVEIGSHQPRFFDLEAKVKIDPAYRWEDVKAAIETALTTRFAFAQRGFGQPVTTAEIINLMHNIAGVVAVDMEKLYLLDETGQPVTPLLNSVLPAQTARPNPQPTPANPQRFLPAELLLINVAGITLVEMTESQ